MDTLIERYLEHYQQEIVDAACRLVRIPSVKGEGTAEFPYGIECARALDLCMELARDKGLCCRNYGYHCMRADLTGEEEGRHILFAAHADVAPPGMSCQFPPFWGGIEDGAIIGCGAADDKAPLVAALYALAFFQKHKIPLRDRFSLLIGSDEKSGMHDIDHYLEREQQPDLVITIDDDLPVVIGRSGSLCFSVKGRLAPDIRSICSEKLPQHLYPESCSVIRTLGGRERELTYRKGAKDPIVKLIQDCHARNAPLFSEEQDIQLLRLVDHVCPIRMMADFQEQVDIIPTDLQMEEGHIGKLSFRVCCSKDMGYVHDKLVEILRQAGFVLELERSEAPYKLQTSDPVVKALTDLYVRETGKKLDPYVAQCGATYARKFRYAFGMGTGGLAEKGPLPVRCGSCRADESHSIKALLRAVRIYIKVIWELDTRIDVPEKGVHSYVR